MRTLVNCMTHLSTDSHVKLTRLWIAMRERDVLEDCDLLIVDSASQFPAPIDARWDIKRLVNDEHIPDIKHWYTLAKFHNALGHPFHDGVKQASGSDRAWMKGIEIAIANNYDRYAYIEMDVLFMRPVSEMFDLKTKPVACGPLLDHGKFAELGLFFADVEHLWKCDFVRRYNWRGPCVPEGERRMMDILGDDLELLPLKGARGKLWDEPMDWATHLTMEQFAQMLRNNGRDDLAGML